MRFEYEDVVVKIPSLLKDDAEVVAHVVAWDTPGTLEFPPDTGMEFISCRIYSSPGDMIGLELDFENHVLVRAIEAAVWAWIENHLANLYERNTS